MANHSNRLILTLIACLLPAGCALPPISLSTPDPVKVDINVRLDVYQHGEKKEADAAVATKVPGDADLEARRRNRMGDIQLFKNSRIVGENRLGLLEVRNLPPGEYGEYVTKVVAEENADRSALFEKTATAKNLAVVAMQEQSGALARDRAFNGEWVEVPVQTGGFTWIQKGM